MNALAINVRIALRAIRVNTLRSVLTMLGVIFGVGSVVAMQAVGAGAEARILEEIRIIGANMILVNPGAVNSNGVRLESGSALSLTEADAEAIRAELPDAVAVSPTLTGKGRAVANGANWATMAFGVTPDFHVVREWPLIDGRAFDEDDLRSARKVAILGLTVVEKLFDGADPIGRSVRIDRVPFTVIGVLDRKGQNLSGQNQDDVILLPLSTARNRLLGRSKVNARSVTGIMVKMREGADQEAGMERIRQTLRARHRLRAGEPDDFHLQNVAEALKAKEEASRSMTLFLTAIASVSLIVGGVGVMNIMLVSVTERTREIGVRMAVGARVGDVRTQFLTEAVTLSALGGLIGAALGVAGAFLIGEYGGLRIEMQPDAVLIALVFALLVGIVFGYLPARKAARMDPVEALRHE